MCSILLLPLVARCLETIDVCIWRMSVVVTVWGSVEIIISFIKKGGLVQHFVSDLMYHLKIIILICLLFSVH